MATQEEKPKGVSRPPWKRDACGWRRSLWRERVPREARLSYGRPGREAGRCVPSPLATRRLWLAKESLERTRPAGSAPLLWPPRKRSRKVCPVPPGNETLVAGEGVFGENAYRGERASLMAAQEEKLEGVSRPPWQRDACGWRRSLLRERVPRGARLSYGHPGSEAGRCVPSPLATRRLWLAKESLERTRPRGACLSYGRPGREAGRCVPYPLAMRRLWLAKESLERTRPAGSTPLLWPPRKRSLKVCPVPPGNETLVAGEGGWRRSLWRVQCSVKE
ncbi:hypothetical protein NDU88_006258 [Pleurodeles waltl]|uniref:Uncharacterized protein n=1 Tax=Pleurodeles waltl TaxID=8319 RepID=A0AAV7PQV2_PLEWA|nr:hypothetical protein NDU88_006258 [Pleurodeles waltl]